MCTLPKPPAGELFPRERKRPRLHSQAGASPPRLSAARVTSDMDGDAIGGAINLVTKNTPYKRVLNATVGTGYNWVSEKPALNWGLTFGDRYFDDKLGVMLAASYQNAPGGADNTEFEYDVDDDGNVYLDKAEIRQY